MTAPVNKETRELHHKVDTVLIAILNFVERRGRYRGLAELKPPRDLRLAPCPFCSETDLLVVVDRHGHDGWMECNQCMAKGPFETVEGDEDDAPDLITKIVDSWNKRAQTPDEKA